MITPMAGVVSPITPASKSTRRHEEENRDSHQSEVYFSGLQGTGQGSGSHHQESDAEPEYQLRAASRKKCRKELKINAVDKQISSGHVRSVC